MEIEYPDSGRDIFYQHEDQHENYQSSRGRILCGFDISDGVLGRILTEESTGKYPVV